MGRAAVDPSLGHRRHGGKGAAARPALVPLRYAACVSVSCYPHPVHEPPPGGLVSQFLPLGVRSGSHLSGLFAPLALSSSPLTGHSDEGQELFRLHYLPGGWAGAGLFDLGSKYFLDYIEGKTWSSLDDPYHCLVPCRDGKRKEAMGDVTLVTWSRRVDSGARQPGFKVQHSVY